MANAPTSDALKSTSTSTNNDGDGAEPSPIPPDNAPDHFMSDMTNTLNSDTVKPTSTNNDAINGVQVTSSAFDVVKPPAISDSANREQPGSSDSAAFKPVSTSNDNSDGEQSGFTRATVSVSTPISNGVLSEGITPPSVNATALGTVVDAQCSTTHPTAALDISRVNADIVSPAWMKPALEHFKNIMDGKEWADLLAAWVSFETTVGVEGVSFLYFRLF